MRKVKEDLVFPKHWQVGQKKTQMSALAWANANNHNNTPENNPHILGVIKGIG